MSLKRLLARYIPRCKTGTYPDVKLILSNVRPYRGKTCRMPIQCIIIMQYLLYIHMLLLLWWNRAIVSNCYRCSWESEGSFAPWILKFPIFPLNFQQKSLFSWYRLSKIKFHLFWPSPGKIHCCPLGKKSVRLPCQCSCRLFVHEFESETNRKKDSLVFFNPPSSPLNHLTGLRHRCVTSTGRFTTACTLERRTAWYPPTRESTTTTRINTSDTNSTTFCKSAQCEKTLLVNTTTTGSWSFRSYRTIAFWRLGLWLKRTKRPWKKINFEWNLGLWPSSRGMRFILTLNCT